MIDLTNEKIKKIALYRNKFLKENLCKNLQKATVIKAPKYLYDILKNRPIKIRTYSLKSRKAESFSCLKNDQKKELSHLEKAVADIEKYYSKQHFKFDHLKQILLENKISLKDLYHYQKKIYPNKQLKAIAHLIKKYYGDALARKATSSCEKKTINFNNSNNFISEREHILTRITDFNKN